MCHRWDAPAAMLLFPLLLAGCKNEATDFNNELAGLHAELGDAVAAFGGVLSPIAEGDAISPEQVQSAFASLLREAKAVQAKSEAVKPPPVPGAEELYEAHRRFLEHQQTLIDDDLKRIARLAADREPNADKLYRSLRAEMRALDKKEADALATLHEAQRAFAKANGLDLDAMP